MGWADKQHRFISIWKIERPVGWFSPFQEWIGNVLIFFSAILALILSLVLSWLK